MSRSPKSVYLFLLIETQKSNSNLDEAFSIRPALGTSAIVKTEYITWILNKNFSLHVCLFEKTLLWVTAKLIYIFVAIDWHILSGTFLPYGSYLFFLFCTQEWGNLLKYTKCQENNLRETRINLIFKSLLIVKKNIHVLGSINSFVHSTNVYLMPMKLPGMF